MDLVCSCPLMLMVMYNNKVYYLSMKVCLLIIYISSSLDIYYILFKFDIYNNLNNILPRFFFFFLLFAAQYNFICFLFVRSAIDFKYTLGLFSTSENTCSIKSIYLYSCWLAKNFRK